MLIVRFRKKTTRVGAHSADSLRKGKQVRRNQPIIKDDSSTVGNQPPSVRSTLLGRRQTSPLGAEQPSDPAFIGAKCRLGVSRARPARAPRRVVDGLAAKAVCARLRLAVLTLFQQSVNIYISQSTSFSSRQLLRPTCSAMRLT